LAEARLPFFALADRMFVDLDLVALVLEGELQVVGERRVDARIRNENLEFTRLALSRHRAPPNAITKLNIFSVMRRSRVGKYRPTHIDNQGTYVARRLR